MAGSRVTEFRKLTLDSLKVAPSTATKRGRVRRGSAPAWPGACDRLSVHGIIKDKHPDNGATRVVVEVWVENQHAEKTAVGHSTGLLS